MNGKVLKMQWSIPAIRVWCPAVLLAIGIGAPAVADDETRTAPAARGDARFREWDADKDGKLTRSELPPNLRRLFDRVDRDGDGFISPAEHAQVAARRPRPANAPAAGRPSLRLPEGVRVKQNVPYVADEHERQQLDLYLPKSTGEKLPLVVWIHGGGWRNGSKDRCPAVSLLDDGIAVASINYRLSGHDAFPAQIHDCKAAIRWLRSHADEYGYDGEHIGVWGSSAGGHLVALLGTTGDVAELEGDLGVTGVSSRVQAVCDYYGPAELLAMGRQSRANSRIDHDAANSPESLLLGGPIQEMQELARQASPLTHVSADDPPFLIVHGDADPIVPVQQSRDFHAALERADVDSELVIVPDGGHGSFQGEPFQQRVRDFFARTLQVAD